MGKKLLLVVNLLHMNFNKLVKRLINFRVKFINERKREEISSFYFLNIYFTRFKISKTPLE